ncbi:MAG: hypothetical protein Q9182_005847 [Xanthomendoza sp. 2 TL-2023]
MNSKRRLNGVTAGVNVSELSLYSPAPKSHASTVYTGIRFNMTPTNPSDGVHLSKKVRNFKTYCVGGQLLAEVVDEVDEVDEVVDEEVDEADDEADEEVDDAVDEADDEGDEELAEEVDEVLDEVAGGVVAELVDELVVRVVVEVAVGDVRVVMVEARGGLQEQAELYLAGAVPQAAEARLAKPVAAVLTVTM